MLKKTKQKGGKHCRVTFSIPAEIEAERVMLLGDFNDWDRGATPLVRRKAGYFSTTLVLSTDRTYRFRYLLDGKRWENDEAADELVPNPFGTKDSVVKL